jgi:phosphoglycerate dehydrogenase-like enzyme
MSTLIPMNAAVAVASHSFSKHPTLRQELAAKYSVIHFNETGRPLDGDGLVRFLRGHQKAITGLEVLDEPLFCALPELRVVSKYGVGVDMIDLAAARRHGVEVRWTPGVNSQAVAELTVGFMIALCRQLVPLSQEVRAGVWRHYRGGRQISASVVGLIGCGCVGQQVARAAVALGARVLAYDIREYGEFYRAVGVEPVSFATLLRESDIVSIHVPLDSSTRHMIGQRELALMKASAFLINTARGGILDEDALQAALAEHRLAGAALDVFATEPPTDSPLLGLANFIATPHVGGGTEEAVLAMGRAAIAGLDAGPGTIDLTAPQC